VNKPYGLKPRSLDMDRWFVIMSALLFISRAEDAARARARARHKSTSVRSDQEKMKDLEKFQRKKGFFFDSCCFKKKKSQKNCSLFLRGKSRNRSCLYCFPEMRRSISASEQYTDDVISCHALFGQWADQRITPNTSNPVK